MLIINNINHNIIMMLSKADRLCLFSVAHGLCPVNCLILSMACGFCHMLAMVGLCIVLSMACGLCLMLSMTGGLCVLCYL